MLRPAIRCLLVLAAVFLGACASRPLPKYEKPIARARVQHVRTTAYTHSEADHIQHGRKTALGTTLQCGTVHSAAADWSRWPAGTVFRIQETGEVFRVDDYGWALSGTNTIDLYKPSRQAMNKWGVRRVTIENLAWGDVDRSLAILRSRSKYKHVRRMIDQIEDRYTSLKRPLDDAPSVASAVPVTPNPITITPIPAATMEPPVRRAEALGVTVGVRAASNPGALRAAPASALVPFNSAVR